MFETFLPLFESQKYHLHTANKVVQLGVKKKGSKGPVSTDARKHLASSQRCQVIVIITSSTQKPTRIWHDDTRGPKGFLDEVRNLKIFFLLFTVLYITS
jgi:hypothetical protein